MSAYPALAAAVLMWAFDPAGTWWFPSCPLRELTGWLCPFCGSLRAMHALLHGAPRVALALNPLVTLWVFAGLAVVVHDTMRPTRAWRFERLLERCFNTSGLSLMLAFGVVRNLV